MPLMTAHDEYIRRPADERYLSVSAMLAAAEQDKALSQEKAIDLRGARAIVDDGRIKFAARDGGALATFTHYSFGQLSGIVGAPANYLRSLSPELGAAALNEGIGKLPADQVSRVLLRAPNGRPEPLIRAINGKPYSRLYDADWLAPLQDTLGAQGFRLPMAWDGKPAGAYRGDRDSFLIVVDGGSVVEDPSLRMSDGPDGGSGGAMYRGLMVRNSEVGYAAREIISVLFRAICGNLMLWGAVIQTESKRRHVGGPDKLLGDTLREIGTIARQWVTRPASADEAIIRKLIDTRVATKPEDLIAVLRSMGADKETAEDVVKTTAAEESQVDPLSYWGVANGLTRVSQKTEYRDDRLALDLLAARLMARANRVAAGA